MGPRPAQGPAQPIRSGSVQAGQRARCSGDFAMANRLVLIAALCAGAFSLQACGRTDDGAGQKTAGKIEGAVGDLTGNEKLQREGRHDEVVGGVKETVQDAKEAIGAATK